MRSIFAILTYESVFYFCFLPTRETVCSISAFLTYETGLVLFLLFLPLRESLFYFFSIFFLSYYRVFVIFLLFLPLRESLFYFCCFYV